MSLPDCAGTVTRVGLFPTQPALVQQRAHLARKGFSGLAVAGSDLDLLGLRLGIAGVGYVDAHRHASVLPPLQPGEELGFQELLGDEFHRAFRAAGMADVAPWTLENYAAKGVRIRRLGPLLAQRRLKFRAASPGTK